MVLQRPKTALSVFSGDSLQKLLKDKSTVAQTPYNVVRSHLHFDRTDSYWWDTTAVVLSKFMIQAGYPLAVHYKALAYFYDNVLPAWGPILRKTDGQPGDRPWKGTFLEDGSTFEPSINLRTTGTSGTSVRFSIEASNVHSGTAEDPLNQEATHDLVIRCAAADPDFDLTVYNYMVETLMFDKAEANRLKNAYPNDNHPQILFAFDFERSGRIMGKCVPFLDWKSKQQGISRKEVAMNFISGVPEVGPLYNEALVAWNKFLTSYPADFGGEPATECLNFDVLKPSKSLRIKIYNRPHKTSFNSARFFYTFGGMLNDNATLKGVEVLRKFYEVVFDIKDGEEDKELTAYHTEHGSVLFNLAFKPGAALPVPQFYITIWKFLPDNASVMNRLAEFWKCIGWNQQADKFADDCHDAFPWVDAGGWGNITNVSIAYKGDGTGAYQSVYYSPMAHDAVAKLGYA